MTSDRLPLVHLLGTGGTIASWGSPRLEFVQYYLGGQHLDVHQNLERIPEIKDFARVEAEQVMQSASMGIGGPEWLQFASKINGILTGNSDVAGVVLTHGTSTMEETAYFLNLTIKSEKPVVVTGSMRPTSGMGTDADNNLLGSIILAGSPEARGKGVMIMLNDEINAARDVTKQNTYRVETFGSRELGLLGYLDSDLKAMFYRTPTRKHTYQTEFDVSKVTELPQVDVVYAVSGGNGLQIRALIEAKVPGIVAAGAGAGSGSPDWNDALAEASAQGLLVVMTSRVGAGRVTPTNRSKEQGIIAGDNLNAQKARILLMLALSVTRDKDRIQAMFETY